MDPARPTTREKVGGELQLNSRRVSRETCLALHVRSAALEVSHDEGVNSLCSKVDSYPIQLISDSDFK
jgi:hypothetical protein